MVLDFGGIYGSKVVIIEKDTDLERGVGVVVREIGRRGDGRSKGFDRWAVRRVFIAGAGRCFLAKVRGINFLRCILQCTC